MGRFLDWLSHTGCVFGQMGRGVLERETRIGIDSSQGRPKRTNRERRKRRATGNSSIQTLTLIAVGCFGFYPHLAQAQQRLRPTEQEMRAVGDAYEALMLQRLYEQMQSSNRLLSAGDDNPFAPTQAEEIFRGMRDQAIIKDLAGRRVLGVSDMVVRQLKGEGGVRPSPRVE